MKFQDFLLEDKLDYIADRQGPRLIDRALEDKGIVRPVPLKDLKDIKKEGPKSESFKDAVLKHLKWFADKFSHKYLQWIVNMYLKGGEFFFEDSEKVRELINQFEKHKSRLEIKDLSRYKSIADLSAALKPFEETEEVKSNKQKEREEIQKMKDEGELKLIGEGSNFKIYSPKTHKASCFLGRGTTWCTSMKNDDGLYKSYTSRGPLYVIVGDKGKYQIHMPSRQVADEQDKPVAVSEILEKYPGVIDVMEPLATKSGYLPLIKDPSPEALAKAVKKGDFEDVLQASHGKELPDVVQQAVANHRDLVPRMFINHSSAFSPEMILEMIKKQKSYHWIEYLAAVTDKDDRYTREVVKKSLENLRRDSDYEMSLKSLGKKLLSSEFDKLSSETREKFEKIFIDGVKALEKDDQFSVIRELTYKYGHGDPDSFDQLSDMLELSGKFIEDYLVKNPEELKSIRNPTGRQKEVVRWALARERDKKFR